MASRSRNWRRTVHDIAKGREEGNWRRIIELAENLKIKSPSSECFAHFLIGEAKLESYLDDNPPIEANAFRARKDLADAKRYLRSTVVEENKERAGAIRMDAFLLLGKVNYAMGLYEDVLEIYELAGLDSATLPTGWSLRIRTESFAIKGLCLERAPSSRGKEDEWQQQRLLCFETASDLALKYLRAQSPRPVRIGPILETALLRAPQLQVQRGDVRAAVTRYRAALVAQASVAGSAQGVRGTLAHRLGELLLLRGGRGSAYEAPGGPSGARLFVPENEHEETVLLLLMGEAVAGTQAVLSQTPEYRDARVRAFTTSETLYDLLTMALARWRRADVVLEALEERAMNFSFREPHVWMQRALALLSLGLHPRALLVLEEVARLLPTRALPCLLAARACYEHLGLAREGLAWSLRALDRETASPQGLASRCHLHVGIGRSLLLQAADAVEAFQAAQLSDPDDHLPEYYLALTRAQCYQLDEAVEHVRAALNARAEHVPSLQLLVLLLSALRRPAEALQLAQAATEEFPDELGFHHARARLELRHVGAGVALGTARRMLVLWRRLHDQHEEELVHPPASPQSTAVELTLSDVAASTLGSLPPPRQRAVPPRALDAQLHIWLLLADVYLCADDAAAAFECVAEASRLAPLSHRVMYLRGRVHEHMQEYAEAKLCFQNAVAINPAHAQSLQRLGLVYHRLGCQELAEKTLREATQADPSSYRTWFILGRVLEADGAFYAASDCLAMALQMEDTRPVLPYSAIPLTFE